MLKWIFIATSFNIHINFAGVIHEFAKFLRYSVASFDVELEKTIVFYRLDMVVFLFLRNDFEARGIGEGQAKKRPVARRQVWKCIFESRRYDHLKLRGVSVGS